MLLERDSAGLKSYLDHLSRVRSLMGKSFGRHLIGKWGRLLGIRWGFGGRIGGFLYALEVLLTDGFFLWLTDGGLQINNA